ncbi:hypothetical protein POTOM_030105 [Populus tomentosa]|uniref:UvrD-like helicase ATP-binding domain-containing protein n=1 Tax=Populus tomentosa TaxID=118781 RepID=A0A8X8CTM7_POPTO|nr:hypothetical protein POTOM_030105 [Populus tomentosa]
MMERSESSSKMMKKKEITNDHGFVDTIFSWSLEDIFNENLFKVENIPKSFYSVEHYLGSYVIPLLEETRAELSSSMDIISTAPFAEMVAFFEAKPHGTLLYDVNIDYWRNRSRGSGKEHYKTLPGDIVILTSAKPENVSDLQRVGWTWTFAVVTSITGDETEDAATYTSFTVKAQKDIEISDGLQKSLTVVSLTNITTSKRIWNALHMFGNLNIIKEILCTDSVVEEKCNQYSMWERAIYDENVVNLSSELNESQSKAVLAYSGTDSSFHSVGDILLFGNKDRLKVDSETQEVYLDYRVKRLIECFAPLTGWWNCFNSTIDFFEDCVSQYAIFVENELIKMQEHDDENPEKRESCSYQAVALKGELKTFLEFMRDRFRSTALPLKRCLTLLCTHIPETCILKHNIQNIVSLFGSLNSFESCLFHAAVISDELHEVFSHPELDEDSFKGFNDILLRLRLKRSECLTMLKSVWDSLRHLDLLRAMSKRSIEEFCFQKATLFLCTASSSYKLHLLPIEPLDFLVVDEAAQLKECESTIPLQLPGIRHAILIGDECQLPAMVMFCVKHHSYFLLIFVRSRYKSCSNNEIRSNSNSGGPDGPYYVENSKVSDSLLLMKFYSLSSGVVSHLLSDRDGRELELPFEVTDEELEIIIFQRSTFILGRSGTGKTTVLTMKLFKKEELYYTATQGYLNTSEDSSRRNNVADDIKSVGDGVGDAKETVLRQLFVTVSPKLCYAIKHHVMQLKSFASGGKYSAEGSSVDMEDIDDAAQFKDIPNSFLDILPKSYPLVITFFKFLMMLDGTMGNSYFERFSDMRQLLHEKVGNSGSISAQTLIRTKEVNFEKFHAVYWPRFNEKFKKKLDSSRVFTEIISHIKGGLQAGESCDGRLSREDYVFLSESRKSTLNMQKRDLIYDIFEDYEKMKVENGDFDMADFVNDLHLRLKTYKYEGDAMDFVYIDEVQDLTMRQIALFKYICRNVDEGFVFSGDTAQTIAKGVDFRFEDIRSLFYKEFVLASRSAGNDKSEKGQISNIFHLNQNFRTHAGVLNLAQSVIDLLYRFFPSFIDMLSPETSLIYGEAPILLESGNDENAIVTIFGNSGNVRSNFVGFGAEQVILVRDDAARKEIDNYVGKHALVLTVVECKGLEFQDVLLYNFFGSSPLKNKWRVVYEFMKEQDLLDANSPSFPSFMLAKHNVLCSELKQLYVAITRTRQRLWICENVEEFSRPMFDYWMKKSLVQVRKLDDSLAQAMQVSSSPEEWKSQGYKLLREGNYEMATMCFERAGDEHGEKLSKASGLRAAADRMHSSNPEMASVPRRQAAEIFESIGKAEYAAECFYMLKEYDRAGRIYLQCGESAMERAGECFLLAENYCSAAEVYAKGCNFSKCLSACTEGKLFDTGLHYIQYWKQQGTADKRSREMDTIEQEFLESCACHYYKINDNRAMMKYVRAFDSMSSARTFLTDLGCLDELLSLEVESGNFLEAAGIAKLKGDLVLEADLLGSGGHFKEASLLILWFVFANSLWSTGSKGWPLKQFPQREELLTKAKLLAKDVSAQFYEFVHTEAEILLNSQHNLFKIHQSLDSSRRHSSIRGEILSARKILDMHLQLNTSKYLWENDLVSDLARLSERNFLNNQVSAETLVYFWNFWKDKIVNIFKFLGRLEMQDVTEYGDFGEFCLNYLGVKRQFNNVNAIYFLMILDAQWVREIPRKFIQRKGNLVSVDVHQFIIAAQGYWCSELLSVGMNVLTNLEALYNFSVRNSLSLFCQSRSLTHIYEVANFLLNCQFLSSQHGDIKALRKFTRLATGCFYDCIYPRDWRESLKENMISLRRTEICRNLLKEVIFEDVSSKNNLSYAQLGRITSMILGSGEMVCEPYEKMADGLQWNPSWKAFIEDLCRNVSEVSYMWKLHEALVDTYNANWRKRDYILPGCFLYMLERQLILLSYFQGYCLTTKSSFVEWLIYQEGHGSPTFESLTAPQSTQSILKFIVDTVQLFLYEEKDMMEWIRVSEKNVKVLNDYHAVVVLRLVVIICLIYVNFGWCKNLLSELLGRTYITKKLPSQFYDAIRKRQKHNSLNVNPTVVAEAFSKIGNPLVVVSFGKNCSRFLCPDAIFVDMINESKDNVLRVLFAKTDATAQDHTGAVEANTGSSFKGIVSQGIDDSGKIPELPSNVGDTANWNSRCGKKDEGNPPLRHDRLWEIFEALKSPTHGVDERSNIACDPTFKVDIDRITCLLKAAIDGNFQNPPSVDNKNLLEEASTMLHEMGQLNAALEMREPEHESDISTIGELLEKLQSRRPRMEFFLSQIFLQHDENLKREMSETNIASDDHRDEECSNSKAEGSCVSAKGEINISRSNVETGGSNPDMENKGKGNSKSKKNKRGKGGRKRK